MNIPFKKGVVAGAVTALILSGVPVGQAQAQSNADLKAQIEQLLATIAQLQEKLGTNTNTGAYSNYTWTRSLSLGSTGEDVRMLQRLLNSDPATQVAFTGAGSPGNETTYFGPATRAAVIKFQNKYHGEVLAPHGLISGTGYFGPSSIAKANALAKVGGSPTTPTPKPDDEDKDDKPTLRGEGTLGIFEIDAADEDEIQEAAADAPIAELTLEAKHGDIRINRLDIALVADNDTTERDPWDVFEEVSLWVDGKKVAEERIDDRSDYLNRNLGTVRFSNLNIILEEDEEVEMTLAASIQNGVDDAGSKANWSVSVERLRYFDADGVANDDTRTDELGDSVSFSIVERGHGEELKFTLGSNNPDASTIIVDTSRRTTNETILEYTIEAIDADIELETLYVNVETGTAPYASVVDDIYLVIGKQTFRDVATVTTGDYSATSTRVEFDIDNKIEIDEDEDVTVRVVVDLRSQSGYSNGETIRARVTPAERDLTEAEGSDDIEEFSGTVIGKVHTLISEGIVVPKDSFSYTTDSAGKDNTVGIFNIEFEVTAVEDDFYIANVASSAATSTEGGVRFTVEGGTLTTLSAVLDSDARETNGAFIVREGETETFTLNVVIDPDTSGYYRVSLDTIYFSNNSDGTSGIRTLNLLPTNDYRSGYRYVNN